jgi:ribonuclease HI
MQTKPLKEAIACKQLNLAKSQIAMANLAKCLVDWSCSPLLVFLQEPWTPATSGRIGSMPRGTQIFSAHKPRAAILATPDLKLWPMPDFTSQDVVAVIWKTGYARYPEIIVVSVYADINKDAVPMELINITKYCGDNNLPLVLGADTNAHSSCWGCSENNSRGDEYELFIASNNLSILNVGSLPTFQTTRASSIIDVSFVTYDLYDLVQEWRVSEEDFLSDHKCIEFEMNLKQPNLEPVRNWQRTDWPKFESCVLSKGTKWEPPTLWSRATLDKEVELFSTEVYTALEESTPTFIPRQRLRKNAWWNADIAESRKLVRVSYRKWIVTRTTNDRQKYVDARYYMKQSVRMAKVESWQSFCTEADSSKELARLNKILQRNVNRSMGLLRRQDGVIATSPEESIDILLDEHFPGSIPSDDLNDGETYSDPKNWASYPWLSDEKIRKAMSQFAKYKTAGMDNLKPVVLQHLPPRSIERLGILYKASMELEYVPKIWRISKAIFIPKTGKEDYAHVRSWRPISLMSFVFKTLERLILWHLEESVLKECSMHKNQHAFRKGRSTESALSDTVDYLESEVLRQGVAIAVFLDIEGAFDNLLPGVIVNSLRERKTPEKLTMWFQKYLRARDVSVDYKGVIMRRRLVKGTPQGGVLSPVLWNIAFDQILSKLDGSPIKACGYADDLGLVGRGPDPTTTIKNMQKALDIIVEEGRVLGLRFSASKSIAIAFTRKLRWEGPQLRLNNTEMEWQPRVRYLGVVLDKRLSWSVNFQERITKAKKLLFKYKQIVGREYGPQPNYMRWMFTGIVRPALTYGSVVWWRIASDIGSMEKLTKVNRLALLTCGPVRKSTPTVGMEVMAHLPPLDLFLEGEVVKSWIRIRNIRSEIWDGIGSHRGRGHRHSLRKLTDTFPIPDRIEDEMPEMKKWNRRYRVDTDFQHGKPTYDAIKCFTDGARSEGKAGAGYCIMVNGQIVVKKAFPLGKYANIFQAELIAILHAAEALQPYGQLGQITVQSDSQAALLALNNVAITSKVVLTTAMELDKLAEVSKYPVKLAWVKSHAGHVGNETADSLAKEGVKMNITDQEPVVPVPKSQLTHDINEEVDRRWNRRWRQTTTARQSRALWPVVDNPRSKQLLMCGRQEFGEVLRLLTGHNHLNRHSFLLEESETADCRFCLESEETSEHLLCECPALNGTRFRVLGVYLTDAETLSHMPFSGLRRFISILRQKLTDEGLEQI